MSFLFKQMVQDDCNEVVDIFNYYVKNSFAAYLENEIPYEFFCMMLKEVEGYPAVTVRDSETDKIVGFGMLKAYHKFPTFAHTAEVSYFISPDYTGKGLGKKILTRLTSEGKQKGVEIIVASISSLNEGSIKFHAKNGFKEVGRLENVGKKNGQYFDVVWMQKSTSAVE